MSPASNTCRGDIEFHLPHDVAAQLPLSRRDSTVERPSDATILCINANSLVIPPKAEAADGNLGSAAEPAAILDAVEDSVGTHAAKDTSDPTATQHEADNLEASDSTSSYRSATAMLAPPQTQTWRWISKGRACSLHASGDASTEIPNARTMNLGAPRQGLGGSGKAPDLASLQPFLPSTYDRLPKQHSQRTEHETSALKDSDHSSPARDSAEFHRQCEGNASTSFVQGELYKSVSKAHPSVHQKSSTGRQQHEREILPTLSQLSLPSSTDDLECEASSTAAEPHDWQQKAHDDFGRPSSLHPRAASRRWRPVSAQAAQTNICGISQVVQEKRHKPPGPAAEGVRDGSSRSSSQRAAANTDRQPRAPDKQAASTWSAIQRKALSAENPQSEPRPSAGSLWSRGSLGSQPDPTESVAYARQRRPWPVHVSVTADNPSKHATTWREGSPSLLNGADLLDSLPPISDMLPPAAPAEVLLACMQALPEPRQAQLRDEAFHLALAHRVQPDKSSL
jgi:hypothetical protein